MISNADCTIYHKGFDPATRLDKWTLQHFNNVAWRHTKSAHSDSNGLTSDDVSSVRIYTDENLNVGIGDVAVKGIVNVQIKGVKDLSQEHFIVTAINDNRHGSLAMHHWKLGGE